MPFKLTSSMNITSKPTPKSPHSHPYLPHSHVCKIESWAEGLPKKRPSTPTDANSDWAIQEYLKVKRALLSRSSTI